MRGRWEILSVNLSLASEIQNTFACDLDEIAHTARAPGSLDEFRISLLAALAATNFGFDYRR